MLLLKFLINIECLVIDSSIFISCLLVMVSFWLHGKLLSFAFFLKYMNHIVGNELNLKPQMKITTYNTCFTWINKTNVHNTSLNNTNKAFPSVVTNQIFILFFALDEVKTNWNLFTKYSAWNNTFTMYIYKHS